MKNVIQMAKVGGTWIMSKGTQIVGTSKHAIRAGGTGVLVAGSSFANAALDEAVTDLITGLLTDAGLLFAACVALWAGLRGFLAVFKLGNKFISKAGA